MILHERSEMVLIGVVSGLGFATATPAPNIGNIADSMQITSRNFAALCNEIGRLENLPSVHLLIQLRSLNDALALKEELKKFGDQIGDMEDTVGGSAQRVDALVKELKAVRESVQALESRVAALEQEQKSFRSTTNSRSVLNRPVRPKLLKTGRDGQTPSVRG